MQEFIKGQIRVLIDPHGKADLTSFIPLTMNGQYLFSINPIPVGGHPLPYSFIVLTHIKVKLMTLNDLTIPLWQ